MTTSSDWPNEETLLDYLAGRLEEADKRAVDDAAANDPALSAELAVMKGARAALAEMETAQTPGELGWKRLERALDQQETVVALPERDVHRFRPVFQMAAAAAIAAVAVWSAGDLLRPGDETGGFAPATGETLEGPAALVAFEPSATEAEIRDLLRQIGARVIDGPSAIGLWRLGFDTEAARDSGLQALDGADGVVASAQSD